ncbi:MAG: hypothetical protein GY759_12095 [Chloroflexi bacterium]|nr:hypothetical protein [Chloroflexota bacterium]
MSIYPKIIRNGRFIEPHDATIPIFTPSLVGALGVYETLKVQRGKYIALDEHLERLSASVAGAGLSLDVDRSILKQWCFLAVAANHAEGQVRLVVVDLGEPHADVFLYQMSYAPPPVEEYEEGVQVTIYHGERALPLVKSFNTLVSGLARKAALKAEAHDALLVDRDGNISEGSNCNVFAVQHGILMAPPLGTILEGTVMTQVLELALTSAIPVQRLPLKLADVPTWDEAFLTSTRRGVLPIRTVGEHALGRPGPITRHLLQAYRAWEADWIGAATVERG